MYYLYLKLVSGVQWLAVGWGRAPIWLSLAAAPHRSPITSSGLFHLQQVVGGPDHSAILGRVDHDRRIADAAQAETAHASLVALELTEHALDERDLYRLC